MKDCTLCGVSFDGESQYKAFPICDACYSEAFRLDMTVARVLKWEEPNHIIDGIWLGGEGSTLDTSWLLQHDVRHVLTIAAHTKLKHKHKDIQYMQIDVDDDPTEDLRQY